MDIWTIIGHASWVNKSLLLILLLLSVFSWVVVIERWRFFHSARSGDARFFMGLRGELDAKHIHKLARIHAHSSSGRLYLGAEREVERLGRGDADTWEEALSTEMTVIRSEGERGLSVLAIIASSAPFIGLLGTVWGVMIAFMKLGQMEGQPALEVVGPGIAEALIATAMGLFAAIPATIAYNAFGAAQRYMLRRGEEFGRRLVASITPGGEFGAMKRKRPLEAGLADELAPKAEPNVVPLIDVFLVLLVIFMITAPVIKSAIEMGLPQAETATTDPSQGITVKVMPDRTIWIDEERVAAQAFPDRFRYIWAESPDVPVFLAADEGVPYGDVIFVLDELRAAGVEDLGLLTRPEDAGR